MNEATKGKLQKFNPNGVHNVRMNVVINGVNKIMYLEGYTYDVNTHMFTLTFHEENEYWSNNNETK